MGVAISGSNGAAFGVTANASGGRGKGEGKDVTWSNTLVSAGEGLTLVSGGDTTLRGAVASDLPGFLHQRIWSLASLIDLLATVMAACRGVRYPRLEWGLTVLRQLR